MRAFGLSVLIGLFGVSSVAPVIAAGSSGIDVSFASTMNLILVPVTINGVTAGDFVFDTGEATTLIDATVAARLGLTISDPHAIQVPGGTVNVGIIKGVSAAIGGAKAAPLDIQSAPVGFASGVIGRRVSGILGHDFIRQFSIRIDYAASRLTVWQPSDFKYSGAGRVIDATIEADQVFLPISISPHGHAAIVGKFKLDTGSTDSLGMNNNFIVDNHVVGQHEPKIEMPGLAFGGETKGYTFQLGSVALGNATFVDVVVGYTTDSKGFENRNDAGTVGGNLLSFFTLTLDYARNRLIFEPAAAFTATPPSDLVGAMVRTDPDKLDNLAIAVVVPTAAANRAGLKAGDRLLAINGRPVTSVGSVWQEFRLPGDVTLAVHREDGDHSLVVRRRPLFPAAP